MDQSMGSLNKAAQICESLQAYVMCGGGGTRLWPLSRADNPKQNLNLSSSRSMLVETIERIQGSEIPGVISTINLMGGISQIDNMSSSLANILDRQGSIIAEPFGKNTAPAVAIASLHAAANNEDPYVLILPSDHVITPVNEFSKAISNGLDAASKGQIVVFGIKPDSPATGYGYIEIAHKSRVAPVLSFREKPDIKTAKSYLISGKHLWNAGIFLFRASTMISALKLHAPEILNACKDTIDNSLNTSVETVELDSEYFSRVPADSIDFAVMEHATNVTVVQADFNWHDVGSFSSLQSLRNDGSKSTTHFGDVISHDCKNALLHSEGPLIAAVGLKEIAVIATPDVTLVTPLHRAEEVKKLVAGLEESGRSVTKQSPWLPESGAVPGNIKQQFLDWLHLRALPYWAQNGCDEKYGGFHEVLDFQGNSVGADKRLRTMARQIFTYAKAKEMGWKGDSTKIISHGISFLKSCSPEKLGGWAKTFKANSSPLDRSEDLYDHAFVLLALAQCQIVGFNVPNVLLQRVLGVLDSLKIPPSSDQFLGYQENGENELPRRSNPHMHLLEAFLAAYRATNDQTYLDRAAEIVCLLEDHFYDPINLMLGEAFDADLKFEGGMVKEFEPGHHFEWARLLLEFATVNESKPIVAINALFANGKALGINPVSNLAHDLVSSNGTPDHLSARCWVQTEYASCLNTLCLNGKSHLAFEAERTMENLWNKYIVPAPDGMWIDVVDGRGNPVSQTAPASTFYHLIGCIDIYIRSLNQRRNGI